MAEIVWLGHASFRLKSKDATIVTDPYDKSLGLGNPGQRADIVTVSHRHPHHDAVATVKGDPMVIDGPGEYEVRGVFITGVWSYADAQKGEERGRNIIFLFHLDDLIVCHLGSLGHTLNSQQLEAIGGVDVLLVPVGGSNASLSATKASEVISQIEPKVVIPMHYSIGKETLEMDSLDKFTKEMGLKDLVPQDKFAMKASELGETTQVVVLEAKI
jgi:L-ascorbate metabolism protein UlaG (beta-lactamase superfamily)